MVGDGIVDALSRSRLVPVIRTPSRLTAERACEWLVEAGCRALEITLSVPDAAGLIADLKKSIDGVTIGAGTVLDASDAERVVDAGAEFLVSPCHAPEVRDAARRLGVPLIPGAATPSEVFARWREGAPAVKVFPAAELGGPAFLKALRSVMPEVPLMPTGGVGLQTIEDYFSAGAICIGMGGALTPREALESNDKASVVELAKRVLERCDTST